MPEKINKVLSKHILNRKIILIYFFLVVQLTVFGQNLDGLGFKNGVKLSGSINFNTTLYQSFGIKARRDPFNWFLTGSLNVNFFGYNAPFSFSYSNLQSTYSQPFNQFNFSPQYKWIKTYLGYTSMSFSPYTLSGHIFSGAGVELTPGSWKISLMYGRLNKAVPFNLEDSTQNYSASFKRIGYAIKIGYDKNGELLEINYFAAKDDPSSIPFILEGYGLTPKQNIAMGIHGKKKIIERLFIEGDYAVSVLNNNINANGNEPDTLKPAINLISGLIPQNATQRYFDAFNGSIAYRAAWYGIQIKYERIAPGYQTLGAYYFNNDLENVTVAPSLRLFKNKLNITANVGSQQNNLDHTKASTTRRLVGSCNIGFTPNLNWNFTAGYSNFSSYTNMRPRTDPNYTSNADTLNFYQITSNYNSSVVYNFGTKTVKQSILLNILYQKANNHASYIGGSNLSDFYTLNASYNRSLIPSGVTLSGSFNYYLNQSGETKTTYWGPNIGLSKSVLEKKMKILLSNTYNYSRSTGTSGNDVLNNRLGISYNPANSKEKISSSNHNFTFSLNRLQQFKGTARQTGFSEWTSSINYNYNF